MTAPRSLYTGNVALFPLPSIVLSLHWRRGAEHREDRRHRCCPRGTSRSQQPVPSRGCPGSDSRHFSVGSGAAEAGCLAAWWSAAAWSATRPARRRPTRRSGIRRGPGSPSGWWSSRLHPGSRPSTSAPDAFAGTTAERPWGSRAARTAAAVSWVEHMASGRMRVFGVRAPPRAWRSPTRPVVTSDCPPNTPANRVSVVPELPSLTSSGLAGSRRTSPARSSRSRLPSG